jgi:hypothetical protein
MPEETLQEAAQPVEATESVETQDTEQTLSEQLMEGQEVDPQVSESEQGTVQPPAQPSLVDTLSNLGFQDVSDDNAQDRLVQSFSQQQQQINELRRQNEQMQQLAAYGNQYLHQQQAQSQPQQPQQEGWWAPPDVDTELINKFRVRGEDGRMSWRQDTPPEIRSRGEAYDAYVEKWADDLVNRPHEALPKIIEAEFDRLFQERYQSVSEQQRQEQVMNAIITENSNWIYQLDPVTNRPAVGVDGRPRVTQAGQVAMQHLQRAESMGIQRPEDQWQFVMTALAANAPRQQEQAPQSREDSNMDHLRRAAQNTANRDGSLETPEQPLSTSQNKNLSAGHKLLAELRADGQI